MAPYPESPGLGAAVQFTTDTAADTDSIFPLRVEEVGKSCFEQAPTDGETASTFQSYLRTSLSAEQAIEEALTIVATAPAFDSVEIKRVDHSAVTAEVNIQTDLREETLTRMKRKEATPNVEGWVNKSTDTWHVNSKCAGRHLFRTTMDLIDALEAGFGVCGKCSKEFLKYSHDHAARECDAE